MQEFDRKETREGKAMGILWLSFAIFFIVLIITLIILGYFVTHEGKDGEIYDGLGRLLDEVPSAMSLILHHWAGYIWFIIDCVITLSVIVIIDKMIVKSKNYFKGTKNVDF